MTYFLTSSPFGVGSPYLNPANRFIDLLKEALPSPCAAVFVCSDPDRRAFTDHIALDMKNALEAAGFFFSSFHILDGRNARDTEKLVKDAGLVVLAGGHVPTQNAFLRRVKLREAMQGYHGVVIGISAGSMNCADVVYAQPEEPGEAVSPEYRRFLPGLGVTETMLLPHYQMVKDAMLDGMRLFEDITCSDSFGRAFYAMPDSSYLLGKNGAETIFGECYRISDGSIRQVSRAGETYTLTGKMEK